jgi:hypothetical protein
MDPGNHPDDAALSKMTVAQIFLDAVKHAAHDIEFAENTVTWALDMEKNSHPWNEIPLGLLCQWLRAPAAVTLCHPTANWIFGSLTAYGTAISCLNLASDVSNAHAQERTAFRVELAGHSFVVVVRNGKAELLQSFMSKFALGRNLLQHQVCFDPDFLGQNLGALSSAQVRRQLFKEDVGEYSIRTCERAPIKTDLEIWNVLFRRAVSGLESYRYLRSRCNVAAEGI